MTALIEVSNVVAVRWYFISTGGLRSRICWDTSMTRLNSFSANSSSSALVITRGASG